MKYSIVLNDDVFGLTFTNNQMCTIQLFEMTIFRVNDCCRIGFIPASK